MKGYNAKGGFMRGVKINSKFFLMVFLAFIALSVSYASVAHAVATLDIKGDLPIVGTSINVWLYDAAQSGNPCGGVADAGTNLIASGYISSPGGNTNYNGNDDYDVSDGTWSGTGYIYYCDGTSSTNLRAYYTKTFSGDEYIDLGRVDGNNLVASVLNGNNVAICKSLGGTKLSTQQVQISAQTYAQYYVKDIGNNINGDGKVYVLVNPTDSCTFDTNTLAGRWFDVNDGESYNNYGISVQFHPDRLVSGELHPDLSDARIDFLAQDAEHSLGLAKASTITDCSSGDDYSTYIDSDVITGQFKMRIYSDDAGTNLIETVEKIPHDFTSQDLLLKISGTIPSDITEVKAVDNNGVEYAVTPSGGQYKLYTPDISAISSLTIKFYKGSNVVFEKTITPPTQANNCGSDLTLDLAKYYGTAHDDLKTGYEIEVYSDSSFTTEISDPSHRGNPDDSTGEYEVYFDVTGGPVQTYLKIDGQYDTFVYGESVSAGDSIEFNPRNKIYGVVHTDVSKMVTDFDQDGSEWDDFGDIYTNTFVSSSPGKEYRMYTDKALDSNNQFDVLAYDSTPTLLLKRQKSFTSDIELDIAKLSGNIAGSFDTDSDGSNDPILIYDSYPGAPLNSLYFVTDSGGATDDTYYAYFECTPTVMDGNVDVYFKDDSGRKDYSLRLNVDKNPSDGDSSDSIVGGDDITLDMTNTITGELINDIDYMMLNDGTNDWVKLGITGTWPHPYTMYFDSISGGTWYLNVYDEIYTGDAVPRKVLGRTRSGWTGNSNTLDGKTFYVSKVIGEAHSNLETGDDEIDVYSDSSCTNKVSSEEFNPIDNGYLAGNDYTQYFEAQSSSADYYIGAKMVDASGTFVTCGNKFSASGASYPNKDLVVDKTGVVTSDIAKVGVDLDEDGTDDASTSVVNTGSGYVYHLFTTTDNSVDVNYYDSSSKVLKIDEDFSQPGTHVNDISKVTGTIPTDIASVELEYGTYKDGACDGAYYTKTTPSGGHYTLYFQDDGTRTYDILFCKSSSVVLKWQFLDSVGGNTVTIDVAKFYGKIDDTFDGTLEVWDSIGGTKLSSSSSLTESGAGTPDDYEIYFIDSDNSKSLNVDSVDMKFTDSDNLISYRYNLDNSGSAIDGGDEISVDFTHKVSGKVHPNIVDVYITDKSSMYENGIVHDKILFLAQPSGAPCKQFSMYVDSKTSQNGDYYLEAWSNAENGIVFTKQQGANSASIQSELDVGLLKGNINGNFVDSDTESHMGGTPSVDVFSNWNDNNPSNAYNSHSFIKDGSPDSYKTYVETTGGIGPTLYIRMIDKDGYVSWSFATISMQNCDESSFNADVLVSGTTSLTQSDRIFVVDSSAPSSYLAAGIPKGANEGDDGTYRIYTKSWSTSAPNSVDFIIKLNGASGEKVLQRQSDTPTTLSTQTFDIIKLYGTIKGSYYDGSNDAPVEVYSGYSTSTDSGVNKLSSYNEDDSVVTDGTSYDNYAVYFEDEGDDHVDVSFTPSETTSGTTSYTSWRMDVDETPSDDTSDDPLQAGDIIELNLDRVVSGYVPASVEYINLASQYPSGYGEYALASIFTSSDNTPYKIYFDDINQASNSYWWFEVFANYGSGSKNVLVRQKGDQGDSLYAAVPDGTEFDVGRIVGAYHNNLNAANDGLYVYTSDSSNMPHEVGDLRSDDRYSLWFQDGTNYYVYFEQLPTSHKKYILNINDTDSGSVMYASYDRIWDDDDSKVGDTIGQDLDAMKYGTIDEECNHNRLNGVLITIERSGETVATANTYWDGSYDHDGTYRLYVSPGTYNLLYERTGFIDYPTTEMLNSGDNQNDVTMQYVAKVGLWDDTDYNFGPYPVTNANVWMIRADDSAETEYTCEDGNGNYYFAVDPSEWSSVDFKVSKKWYENVYDDAGGAHYAIDDHAQRYVEYYLDLDKNAVGIKLDDVQDGSYVKGSVDLSAVEFSKYDEVVFNDSFENGNTFGWQSSGFWHITNRRSYDGDFAWWYGQENTGDYDNGNANSGDLISKSIDLTGVRNATLSFATWWKIETDDPYEYDLMKVYVSTDDGATWTEVLMLNPTSHSDWAEEYVDLTPYVGNRIKVRFSFDTVDNNENNYEGWYIDDFKITTGASVFDNVSFEYSPASQTISDSNWAEISSDTDGSDGWTAMLDTSSLPDGDYYFKAKGTELHYGMLVEDVVGPVHVDNTAPTISSASGGIYKNGDTVIIDASGSEEGLTAVADFGDVDDKYVRGADNFADLGSGNYKIYYTISKNNGKSDGTKNVVVKLIDKAGNEASTTVNVDLDNTKPTTSYSLSGTAGDDGWYKSDVTVTLSATDNNAVSKTMYKVDDGQWTEYTAPFTVSGDGRHIVDYYSVDSVGNAENFKTLLIKIDETKPSTPALISPENDYYTKDRRPTFVWGTAEDETSGVKQYKLRVSCISGTHEYTTSTTSMEITNDLDGSCTWLVKAQDNAGNWGDWTGSRAFVVDGIGPSVSVNAPSSSNTKTFTVTATVDDDYAIDGCRMDIVNVGYYNSAYKMSKLSGSLIHSDFQRTITVDSDGTYQVYVSCLDKAGNVGNGISSTILVSSDAPSVVSVSPSQGYKTTSSAAAVSVETDVPSVCKWDLKDVDYAHMAHTMSGTGTTHTISTAVFDSWSDGLYQIYYRCTDGNGNTMDASGLVQYIIDREGPSKPSPILPKDESVTNSSTVGFQWTASEDATSGVDHYVIAVSQDTGFGIGTRTFTTSKTSHEVSSLGDGTWYWKVMAVDKAGNNGEWSEVKTFNVDTHPPSLSGCEMSKDLISYYPLNTENPTSDVTCNVNDANIKDEKVYVKHGGSSIAEFDMTGGTATIDAKKIGVDGTFDVFAEVEDKAGHTTEISVGTITVDGTAPETIVALDDTTVATQPGGQTTTTVRAVLRDITSDIEAAEFYVGPGDARADISQRCSPTTSMYSADGSFVDDGNRYELSPVDGSFDSGFEEATATVNGDFSNKCIFVHAKDKAGNWEQTKAIYILQNGKVLDLGEREIKAEPSTTTPTALPIANQGLTAAVIVAIAGLIGASAFFGAKLLSKFSLFKLFK